MFMRRLFSRTGLKGTARPAQQQHRLRRRISGQAVSAGDFVIMDFTGKDENGTLVISSDAAGQDGYAYEIGDHGAIPKGLHDMVVGMDVGETKSQRVEAKDAMGERDERLVLKMPPGSVQQAGWQDAKLGAVARLQAGDGTFVVKVVDMDEETITLDANNPLAGQALDFEVTVKDVTKKDDIAKLTVAGGCFWGPELAFQRLPGVIKTCVGYSNGEDEQPNYEKVCSGTTGHAEVVQFAYEKGAVSMEAIMDTLWDTFKDPFQANGQGNDLGSQYRIGVYWHTEDQRDAALEYVAAKEERLGRKCAVEVEEVANFHVAEDYHQQYLSRGGVNGSVQPQSAAKGCTDEIRCYG